MRPPVPARVDATVLGAASVLALAFGGRIAEAPEGVPAAAAVVGVECCFRRGRGGRVGRE